MNSTDHIARQALTLSQAVDHKSTEIHEQRPRQGQLNVAFAFDSVSIGSYTVDRCTRDRDSASSQSSGVRVGGSIAICESERLKLCQ